MQNKELAEIQQKYAGCNLLMPASTEVQLNPFYKITVMEVPVDLSENSGDVFKVATVKAGQQNGRDIYVDTFSPAKPLLMKLAAAAGIQFDPEHTYGTRVDQNTYKAKAFGAMRMPDGTGKTHADEKVICLDDEEANYRLEFMDKSIKGITDEKAAKAAAEMFKGKWVDAVNKWGKACKAYIIDDCDREKYISRSVLVNMTLLRKTAAEKAMTGAINRVIRALTGLKSQYTRAELEKPFAIPRVTFAPDYTDAEVKRVLLSQGMNSIGSLFGANALQASSAPALEMSASNSIFNPEEFTDNLAFLSEAAESVQTPPTEKNWFETETSGAETAPSPTPTQEQKATGYVCAGCGTSINERVYEYSLNKFGSPLCIKCQRGAGE